MRERLITKKVNIFDGQRVTEVDLDTEQAHNNTVVANLALDFHGSGVYTDTPFETRILLDTRYPNIYIENNIDNPSKFDLDSGTYDGKGISLDRQPSDAVRGNRIEFQLFDAKVSGKNKVKILVIGRAFDGINADGELVSEYIEFDENIGKLGKYYYIEIISILFNNFSGGTGKTEYLSSADNLNLISENNGYLIIREAEPLKVFPASLVVSQTESPNFEIMNFITSDTENSIEDEVVAALGATNNLNDLYFEISGKEQVSFEKNGSTTVSYGQKFLSPVDNIQRIDLLMSVERDADLAEDNQLDYSGDLIIAIYELSTDSNCPTDAIPDDLIDFDPEITPLVEISYSQDDLEILGYKLTDTPQIVSFNFAGTLLADPNIDPSIEVNKFYAFLVSRRGDNRTGTILIEKGFDKVTKKIDDGTPLTAIENFGKRTTKYLEFDPSTKRFVNDSESSLWFKIYSNAIEVTDGTAYSDTGKAITISKTQEFVGNSEISNFQKNINLVKISEGSSNYIILSHVEKFTDPGTHPRTGNFLFTRIMDGAAISVVDDDGLDDLLEDTTPIILAKVVDTNVRDAQTITGTLEKPGLIGTNYVMIIDPSAAVLSANLINRIISPDINCNCNSKYRIIDVECITIRPGDFNDDGKYTASDISSLLGVVGNTINSESTERLVFGGELDILDFIRGDLDGNETVDGIDIELLEDAVDGYLNFTVSTEIKALKLHLENVLSDDDYPVIFTDVGSSGITTVDTDTLVFTASTEKQALIIRAGDLVEIESAATDAGIYKIITKEIDDDGLTITLTVSDEDGADIVFEGTTNFNVVISSGTAVNMLADNNNLVQIPFVSSSYEINFIEAPFEPKFLDTCDLRRFTGSSFIEDASPDACLSTEEECSPQLSCEPKYKNQTVIPGDLYIPSGNIMESPGVVHHGDFEYANIQVPLPPGSISDCSVNLYNTFIKGVSGSSLTSAGYPAMKFSDGTIVGCEDSGADNDIFKGRVKFSSAVASIHVDALVDGYADGYVDEEDVLASETEIFESIQETFIDNSFTTFSSWVENVDNNDTITTITHSSGSNQPAIFDLLTSADSGERFGRLDAPSISQDFSGDFIVDIRAARTSWQSSSLTSGRISSFITLTLDNGADGTTILKLGWRSIADEATELFFSGEIQNSDEVVTSTFDYDITAPDEIGEDVLFRLRRIDDVVSAYYIIPDRIAETTVSTFGQYIRIGENPDVQPGSGTGSLSFEILQENSPNAGLIFFSRMSEVNILSEYVSEDESSELDVGRNSTTSVINRATITIPFNLTRRTDVVAATLTLKSLTSGTISDSFNIIPINSMNAKNLSAIYNFPLEENVSLMTTFVPGVITNGVAFDVDVTTTVMSMLSEQGHLPGFYKGFVIEPDSTANSSFSFDVDEVTLTISYVDVSTGIIFKIGVSIDPDTGLATFNTKNILYDSITQENRTVINFGIYLKKAGFKNQDVTIGIADLNRIGIGSCQDEETLVTEDECFFIAGTTATGTYVEGPFSCFS